MDEPAQRLPPEARSYWRTKGGLQGGLAVLVSLMVASEVAGLAWVLLGAAGAVSAVLVLVVPQLRWRRWRYEVREEEIDLQHGTFVMRRTLIPIRRVQHVDTEAGPLRTTFGLTTVTFHTAAGGVSIPALTRGTAETVRARVAELARTRDDV